MIGKIESIENEVIRISLIEYDNLEGLVLSTEFSKKKIKSIQQVAKTGNVEICHVLKVDEDHKHIDLSLRRVTDEEKNEYKELFRKNKLSYQIMFRVAKLADVSVKYLYEKWGYEKSLENKSLYHFFSLIKNDFEKCKEVEHGDLLMKVIQEQFKPSVYKYRIDVDVCCTSSAGVHAIKEAFNAALEEDPELEIALIKSPIYSIVKTGSDKEATLKAVNRAADVVKERIISLGGSFAVMAAAKIFGEKSKHGLLEDSEDSDGNEDSDGDFSSDFDD